MDYGQEMPMGNGNGMDMPMGNADPMNAGAPLNDVTPMDNSAEGGDPTMGDEGNQYDTNFDAGVEADEDADPKKYIQQLTGKLSQKLNSYNSENEDGELSKYVGKMIIKQVAKGLDNEDKKDLIKTLKTTESDDEEIPTDDSNVEDIPDDTDSDMEEMPPMNECRFSKKELKDLFENCNVVDNDEERKPQKLNKKLKTNPLYSKK